MTNETITLAQLIDKLTDKDEPINLKYIEHLRHKQIFNKDDKISYHLETYYPLLESIDFDVVYGMIRYRCDKSLYDEFKSRRRNGLIHVAAEDRLILAKRLFSDCLDEEAMMKLVNLNFIRPYDRRSAEMRSNTVTHEMIRHLDHKIKIDDQTHILYYKNGKEFKEIRNYSDKDFADFLVEPVIPVISKSGMLEAVKNFKRFKSLR